MVKACYVLGMQRRHFIHTLSTAVLSLQALTLARQAFAQVPPTTPPAAPHWRSNPFALGVASGEPRPDAVLLWTRLYPGAPAVGESASRLQLLAHFQEQSGLNAQQACVVHYDVFSDEALRHRVKQGQVRTHAGRGWSVHARVTGLEPNRPYWYRFRCGEAVSPVGRTRTAPALGAATAQMRIALTSCQHYEQGYYAAHAEIAQQSLDVVLFAGDYIYESSNPKYRIRPHTGGMPSTLDQYRERHALYKLDPDLQACHAAHPWVCTWDDHEVENDYAGIHNIRYQDAESFLQRRAAAYQAYFEHMPVWPGANDHGPHQRIHSHYQWGDLVDWWMLDCRQYRNAQPCRDPLKGGGRVVVACDERDDPRRTMLGSAQEQWFSDSFKAAKAHWRLVVQSTQISSTSLPTPVGRSIFTDGWDGYPVARQRLIHTLAQAPKGTVVTLGGDVHMNVAADLRQVPNDPHSPIVAAELVTTSITSRGMGESTLARIREHNPDIRHARSDERGYTLIDVQREHITATFRATPHPVQAGATLSTQAQYTLRHGEPGLARQ
ncbi:MAG: Alkaline phosphatase precursor [Pseudomonadota bacterium]